VIQLVANLRRRAAVMAAFALLVMLSSLAPQLAGAQGEPVPVPAPADSTPVPAPPENKGKKTRPVKARKPKLTKEEKAARAQAEKEAKAKAKAERAAKGVRADADSLAAGSTSEADSVAAPPRKKGKTSKVRAEKVAAATKKKAEKAARVPQPPKQRPPAKSIEERQKEDGIYAGGSDWITLRFGYAKRTGDVAGNGLVGYGVGYQHMITKKVAFAAGAGHDVVGHFKNQLDVAVPFTGELQRHFKWNTAVRPYLGFGGGYYLRKYYRTGNDYNTTSTGGPHLSIGITSGLDLSHVIGFETRVAWLRGRTGVVNPTFGPGKDSETMWTAKLIWGLVY